MLHNKRIWITGGGSGIGRELALQLAVMGNRVVISGRDIKKLNTVCEEFNIENKDNSASIVPLAWNVSDGSCADFIGEQLAIHLGALDICILCAGHCEYVENAELNIDMFRRVFDANFFGVVNTSAIALPLLRKAAEESSTASNKASFPQIIGVGSLSAVVGLPRAEAYGASKAAMNYFFDALRLDVASYNIDVTVVNPGFVATPMTSVNDFPMPFLMESNEAASRIIGGIEKRKRVLNFPFRLNFILRLASFIPALWYKVIGPKLSRVNL